MTIAEERDSSNTVLKRFLAEGVQLPTGTAPNTKLYYSKDHLGSIRSLTNENGTILGTLDYDAFGSVSRAPVPANDTSGAGPVLTSAVSRLTHSFAGTFDVNLPLSGAPGVEMRRGNGSYTLVLTFDRNVLSDTSTTLAAGVGTVGSTTFSGNTATISLSGVADRQTITVELDNVVGVVGVNAKVLVSMSVCIGDVNQNGSVTVEDINTIKSHAGNAVTTSTFQYDLNHDGFIDSIDTAQDKSVASQGASLYPDFAFTGHFYHARSGLYLTRYRAYNSIISRWLSRDPIDVISRLAIMAELLPEGPNVYRYVANNPINNIDFLGLQTSDCRCKDGSRLPLFQCWTQPSKALQTQGWNIWQSACEIAQESCQATCCFTCFSNDPLQLCPRFCARQYLLCIRGGATPPVPPNAMPQPAHPPRAPSSGAATY